MICVQFFIVVLLAGCFIKNLKSAPSGYNALLYLTKYGYIQEVMNSDLYYIVYSHESVFQRALKNYQRSAGLYVTGRLDRSTIEAMNFPRCGVKNRVITTDNKRSKRCVLDESRWKIKNLTYQILNYPRNLKPKYVEDEIQKAFNIWSKFTDLTFTPSKGHVHINIRFEHGEHGDGDPFDGPGGTLAHAFFPISGGHVHFDAAEQWTINSYKGMNLLQTATHEFGHSLGLDHSEVREAVMYWRIKIYTPEFDLHTDDIQAIQALYGQKTHQITNGSGDGSNFSYEDDEDYYFIL